MTYKRRKKEILSVVSLLTVAGLVLSGCSGSSADQEPTGTDEVAEAEGVAEPELPEAEEAVEPELPEADPGIVITGADTGISVSAQMTPNAGEVITPGGTFSVDRIGTAASLPADVLGVNASNSSPVEEEPGEDEGEQAISSNTNEELRPAQGEVFRIIDVSYELSAHSGSGFELALNTRGQQSSLNEIESTDRLILSLPEGEDAHLVVTSEGHDQRIDLHTGERLEDTIAETYYRGITQQDVHHTFVGEKTPYGIQDLVLDPNWVLNSASITPYSESGDASGWAKEGSMWLVLDWRIGFNIDGSGFSRKNGVYQWTVEVDGEEFTVSEQDRGQGDREFVSAVEVPVGAENIVLSTYLEHEIEGFKNKTGTAKVDFDPFEVSFPDND